VPSSGTAYVTIHLDYGLKGTHGWMKSLDGLDTAINTSVPPAPGSPVVGGKIEIKSPQGYVFFSVYGSVEDTATPESLNNFKKFAGIGGVAQTCSAVVKGNARVQIYGPTGALIPNGDVLTDQDGVYLVMYKHIGKAAPYRIKLSDYPGLQQTVTVKSNGWALVNFTETPYCIP
jgi:hypothetical protein